MNLYKCYSVTLGQTLATAHNIHGEDAIEAAQIFASTMDATNNNHNILEGSLIAATLVNFYDALDITLVTVVGVAGLYVVVIL